MTDEWIELIVDGSYYYKRTRLGIGIEIKTRDTHQKFAGAWEADSTNVKAEYEALIHGLVIVLGTHKQRNLHVKMDCKPVVNQILGKFSTADRLKPLMLRCRQLLDRFNYKIEFIPREFNHEADKLSKLCN